MAGEGTPKGEDARGKDAEAVDAQGGARQITQEVQVNIGFANQFRLELIKLVLTAAPALLAFTITFRPTLKNADWTYLMWIGWLALGMATVGGMVNMYGWERFYALYRETPSVSRSRRKLVTRWRRIGAVVQFAGFGVGVLAIATFAAINIDNVVTP